MLRDTAYGAISSGRPFEQGIRDLIGQRVGSSRQLVLSSGSFGLQLLLGLMDEFAGLLPRGVQLGALITGPLAARLFLLLIDCFARLSKLFFDGPGLFSGFGAHRIGGLALTLGERAALGQHVGHGAEEHSLQVKVNDD